MRFPRRSCRLIGCIAISLFLGGFSLPAATLPAGFTETQYGSTLTPGSPTAMAFSPDGRLFVCLQGGQLRIISNGTLLATPFVTVTTTSSGERGLLGVTFDPNFASNQFVYVYYTVPTAPIHNRISRFTANGDVAIPGSETVILELDNLSGATNHNGGAIHFGPDGKLYIGVGENANAANAQSLNNRLGKLLRINADGTVPLDNPTTFPGIAGSPSGDNRAIWSVGLRNPYTFAFQPGTGRIFINDVGQSTWEEINDGIVGSNYGWSICEGACGNPNFRDPLFQYGHSGDPNTTGCAIVGGAFYNPPVNQFPASYVGKYFFGDLCSGWIRLMDPSNNTASAFATGLSTPVDLQVGLEGSLYYLIRGSGGQVWKISATPTGTPTPTPATPTPTPAATPTPTPLVSISGTVLYCSNPVPGPVPNVTLTLTGSASGSTLSDGSGNYTFSSLPSGGNYTVTPSKAARAPGSANINTVDVITVQRHFLVLGPPLPKCRFTAADVDLNGLVNTVDVIAIQRFFLSLTTGIAQTGKYKFTPVSRSYMPLVSNQTAQNYDALVYGDVASPFVEPTAANGGTRADEVAAGALPEVAVATKISALPQGPAIMVSLPADSFDTSVPSPRLSLSRWSGG